MVKKEKALSKEMATLGSWVVRAQQSQSRVHRYCTHLTIDRDRGIQEEKIKYYGQKGGNSCKGVNLSKPNEKLARE
jgi:hypothetical protein